MLHIHLLIYKLTKSETCMNRQMINAYEFDTNQCHIREYFRHLTCNSDIEATFYKCKLTCLREETCVAFRYISFCECCSYSGECHSGDPNIDFLYIKSDTDINRHLGNILINLFALVLIYCMLKPYRIVLKCEKRALLLYTKWHLLHIFLSICVMCIIMKRLHFTL